MFKRDLSVNLYYKINSLLRFLCYGVGNENVLCGLKKWLKKRLKKTE